MFTHRPPSIPQSMARGIVAFVVVTVTLAAETACAIEVGDIVALGNGVSETVIALKRRDGGTVELTTQVRAANASEFCERYERLTTGTSKWRRCVRDNSSSSTRTLTVNCRTSTIVIADGPGAGSYRSGIGSGPWASTANPDWIVQGDGVYTQACGRR